MSRRTSRMMWRDIAHFGGPQRCRQQEAPLGKGPGGPLGTPPMAKIKYSLAPTMPHWGKH
eukprot:2059737-Heterocapsa_arctica.AAC.1